MEPEPKAIAFDVQPETQETQELCRFSKTRHTLLRCQFLMEVDDDELFILDKPIKYIEAISNNDSEKWFEAMRSEMDSMYTNQVWTLVDPPRGIKITGYKLVFKRKTNMDGNV
jgi:hypothetical protein